MLPNLFPTSTVAFRIQLPYQFWPEGNVQEFPAELLRTHSSLFLSSYSNTISQWRRAGQPGNPYALLSNDISHIQATQAVGKYSQGQRPTRDLEKGSLRHEVKGQAVWKVRANHCVARCKQTAYCMLSRREKSTAESGKQHSPAGLPSRGSPSAIRMTRKIKKKTEDRDSPRERRPEREVCGCQNMGHVPVWEKWMQEEVLAGCEWVNFP